MNHHPSRAIALALGISTLCLSLQGCVTAGQEFQADVFDSSQVNTKQEAKTVRILTVSPAKVKVTNEQNRQRAQLIGGILGAATGIAVGYNNQRNQEVGGALAGGAMGAAAGTLVPGTVLVDGVLLGYSLEGKIYTSTQIGRPCQFALGQISLMVTMLTNETRIQPNATCPEPVKS